MQIRKGDIYFADLSPVVGSEQGGVRPVLVVQNDVGNRFSPTIIVAAVTSQLKKAKPADPRTYSRGRQRTRPGFRRTAGTAEDDRQEET